MLAYVSAIVFRYISIVLQFLIVFLIARRLSPHDAGVYFMVFGAITSTYFIAGLGLADGLMKELAEAAATGRPELLRPLLIGGGVASASISFAMVAIALSAGAGLGASYDLLVPACVWWLCYGTIFFAAQVLVGFEHRSLGAFFFYSSMNLFLLGTLVPYLLLAKSPSVASTIDVSLIGAVPCAICAMTAVVVVGLRTATSQVKVRLAPAFVLGFKIAIIRVLQTAIYWIPAWAAGLVLGSSDASLLGVAGRLAVAIGAIMATIRFNVRPSIVAAAAQGDWGSLEYLGRSIATAATALSVGALLVTILVGGPVFAFVFGAAYRPVGVILSVLLVGTVGECIGGPVDEMLKMTGGATVVLYIIVVAVAVDAALSFGLATLGPAFAAAGQAVALVGMYVAMIWELRRRRGIVVRPSLTAVPWKTFGMLSRRGT